MEVSQLNELRKKSGLSIDELARRANLPKSTVEKILFGVVKYPRIDTMQAIEAALGLNQLPVTITEEEKAAGVGAHGIKLSDEEWEIIELFSELKRVKGEVAVHAVLTMIKTILESN